MRVICLLSVSVFARSAVATTSLTLLGTQDPAHDGEVNGVGVSIEGVVSGGDDSILKLWSSESLELTNFIDLENQIYDVKVSEDKSVVVSGEGGWKGSTSSDTLRVFSADLSEMISSTRAPGGYVYTVAISPDNQVVVCAGFYGTIGVFEMPTLNLKVEVDSGSKRTKALIFSPDGSVLASTSTAGTVKLWSTDTYEQIAELTHSGQWSFPVSFSPDGSLLVSGSDAGNIKVWSLSELVGNPEPLLDFEASIGGVTSVDFSPDGSKIAAGGDGGAVRVYDAVTSSALYEADGAHKNDVLSIAWVDQEHFVTSSKDGSLRLWALGAPQPATSPVASPVAVPQSAPVSSPVAEPITVPVSSPVVSPETCGPKEGTDWSLSRCLRECSDINDCRKQCSKRCNSYCVCNA